MAGINLKYTLVYGDNAETYKPLIEEGLLAIGGTHAKGVVSADSVIESLANKQTAGFIISEEGKGNIGFCVISLSTDSDGATVMHGQLAYIKPALGYEMKDEGFMAAELIAESLGATRIRYESARKGWLHAAAMYGYSVTKEDGVYKFSKEVPHEQR